MNCRDRIARAAELEEGDTSLAQALGHRWHLWRCTSCRSYLRPLDLVLQAARSVGEADASEAPGLVDAAMARLARPPALV